MQHGLHWVGGRCFIFCIVMACAYTMMDFAVLTVDAARLPDFLISHHVVAGMYFCNVYHHECCADDRCQVFRCNRQEMVQLHGEGKGGVPRSPKDIHSRKA